MEVSSIVLTPVATEPLTLADAKLYARVDYSDEDALFSELITEARVYGEQITKRALATQTRQAIIEPAPLPETFNGPIANDYSWQAAERPNVPLFGYFAVRLKMPYAPVQSVSLIEYQLTRQDNPEWQTLSATDAGGNPNYRLDLIPDPQEVNIFSILAAERYRITYTTGYTSLPAPLRRALLSLIVFWYDNRNGEAIPQTITDTLLRYKVMEI